MATTLVSVPVASDQALRIAYEDAIPKYGDLTRFRISIRRLQDGWHVDYDLDDSEMQGGGPHYVIDASNGSIIQKTYYQ